MGRKPKNSPPLQFFPPPAGACPRGGFWTGGGRPEVLGNNMPSLDSRPAPGMTIAEILEESMNSLLGNMAILR